MTQAREARLNTIIEYSSGDSYFLYDPDGGHHTFAPDSPEWFAWLRTLGSCKDISPVEASAKNMVIRTGMPIAK